MAWETYISSFQIAGIAFSLWAIARLTFYRENESTQKGFKPAGKDGDGTSIDPYQAIEALDGFDWQTTEPIKFRPFKPKYYLTMAIENITMSELVAIDNTYVDRINLRRRLILDEGGAVACAAPRIGNAVSELYEWLFQVYYPKRYPTMFKLCDRRGERVLQNLVMGHDIPLKAPEDSVEALKIIGGQVDTDFLFLLPSEEEKDEGKYKLLGFVTCFPSGFDTRVKFNRLLSEIHKPVPGYADKLEKSMDRFFASMPAGKIVRRVNWSVTTDPELFALGGNHMYATTPEEQAAEIQKQRSEVDLETAVVRCERQTLHRLPRSGALVFAFKTYTYSLQQIKNEGLGEVLAEAIDGLQTGNVPGIDTYKRGVVWGDKVKRYLRAGS